jgi:cellulase
MFKAGQNITVEMHAQPNDRSCTNQALGGNHFGPVLVYMGKIDDASSGTPTSWFKISEEGYNPSTKKWGTVSLNYASVFELKSNHNLGYVE